jgi:hypothetical protein
MTKRVFRPFWCYDVIATEQWFADMAASGLLLQSANLKKRVFTFIEAEPQKIIYRIDYDKDGRGLSQTLTGYGWGAVATSRQWVIYANKGGIADDCLRDVYVRGKYRDVILPMTVIRRLDAVLEDTKEEVLRMKKTLDEAGIINQNDALCNASGQAFFKDKRWHVSLL